MKPRDYCCCAIPTVNAGIYFTLFTHLALGVTVGAIAVATSSIVGASTPKFAPWVLAILCFVVAGVQTLGFIGVAREKPILYRRFVTLHSLFTSATFSVALSWIVLSAVRHNDAKTRCIDDFFEGKPNESGAETICQIFSWVDVGLMGGLWVIFAVLEIYLYIILSSYGTGQQQAHDDWDRQNDPSQPLTKDSIAMADRSDPWDSRPSEDNLAPLNDQYNGRQYRHVKQNSSLSSMDILNQKPQSPTKEYPNPYNTPYQPYTDDVSQPAYAYTQPTNPTPYGGSYAAQQDDGPVDRPSRAQAHPAEGQFGRKTPRYGRD